MDHVASSVFDNEVKIQEALDTHFTIVKRIRHHHVAQGFPRFSCLVLVNFNHAKEDIAAFYVLPLVLSGFVRCSVKRGGNPYCTKDTRPGL